MRGNMNERSAVDRLQYARSGRGAVTEEIRVGDTSIAVEADDLGRFRAGPVPTGPMSLRCGVASGEPGPPVVTDWVPI